MTQDTLTVLRAARLTEAQIRDMYIKNHRGGYPIMVSDMLRFDTYRKGVRDAEAAHAFKGEKP